MDELIKYIKDCIKPRDETEFIETEKFDLIKFYRLKQDGMMICKEKPNTNKDIEWVQVGNYYIIKKAFRPTHWYIDKDTFIWNDTSEPIYRRLLPPPDESVNHFFIINSILKQTNPNNKSYLEYGVRTGECLYKMSQLVKNSYGVDIQNPQILMSNSQFFRMYTDVFSKEILPHLTINYAFVDADHKFESAYNDFVNIYNKMENDGYIFLHDTYPCEPSFLTPGGCYDCYKTPIQIKKDFPGIQILTLPLNPGVTIVHKFNE